MTRSTTLLVLLMATCMQVFAQHRSIDLKVTQTSPAQGDTLDIGQPFNISFTIKNLGTDTLTLSDTTALYLIVDTSSIMFGVGGNFQDHIDLGAPYLEPGDSAQASFQFTLGNSDGTGWPEGPTTFCVKVLPRNEADSIIDPDTTNNKSCATDLYARNPFVSVNDLTNNIGETSVYPNPVGATANFNINLQQPDNVKILLRDMTGRTVIEQDFGQLSAGTQRLEINTSNLPAGQYLFQIRAEQCMKTGKLLKQ